MKLIIIYGMPATGKLTTAKSLSNITGFPVFHNHLSVNIAREVFGQKSDEYFNLVEDIRLITFEHYFQSGRGGLIFTWFYWGDKRDNHFISKVVYLSQKIGFELYAIKLFTEIGELKKRVNSKNRKKFGKPSSWKEWKDATKGWVETKIDVGFHLGIDNTNVKPMEVAKDIKQWIEQN